MFFFIFLYIKFNIIEIKSIAGEGNGNPLQYSCLLLPWTEEPGGLQSMGSLKVRHNWVTSLSLFTFMHWRRKWQPTPVFLPGESQGQRSLVGCRLWDHTELDTTEATQQQQQEYYICNNWRIRSSRAFCVQWNNWYMFFL